MSDIAINILAMKYKSKLDDAYKKLARIEDTINFYKGEFEKDLTNLDIKLMEDIKGIIEEDYFSKEEKFSDEIFELDEEGGDIF